MSYILDALRKADAERERDPSRGIHAQPAPGAAHAAPRGARWGWMAAGGAGVLLAAGAYVAWFPAPAPVPAPRAMPSAPAAGFVLEAPRKPPVVTIADAVVPPAPPPLPEPAAERAPAKTAAATAPKAAPATTPAAPAPAAAAAPSESPPVAAAPATAPGGAATPERIVAVGDLPADVQRELPKLAISGGVHSENAAQRMLVVGGQVKGEGAELAPGVVLEQIRARSAVLRFKGFRYSVPY